MVTEQLWLLLSSSVALLASLLGLWLLLVTNKQRTELRALRQQIAGSTKGSPAVVSSGGDSFSAQLDAVERRQAPLLGGAHSPAEKYSYVASLADKGMNAVQIADALQMAPAEVEQLLRLSSLKQGG